ncbi:phosphoribosyl-AMP cyclohydrolase [Croceicoccus sp. F390]|uniref:phosphoribosyl-AMP cyclohydrolase n=1 Tax=Croceicoccus esteveae TaxID=3075597 RepID=A0ABU2ZJ37_9SPHN|nr:phosphoribosyl-AMP cyclohydrolase [Croceicoccus sp. F390]MDT0576625.1 phosphoribosyl-AMP cyclohydrolase [Croceicoccus sp. F390]
MDLETTTEFRPVFGTDGLIAAVCVDDRDSAVLMVAHMNADALDLTRRSGFAHFWSRSRQEIWKKGESSGHTLRLVTMFTDCDQDCLLLRVLPAGPACHTLARSCFYRQVTDAGLTRAPA